LSALVRRHSCDLCALTWFTCHLNRGTNLVGPLFHADQSDPSAIYSIDIKTVAVIAQLQVNCVRIKPDPGVKLGCVRMFKRIRQRFLPNVEQVFFDSWGELSRLASDSKFRAQRSACSRVLHDRLKCIGKSSFLERLRSKRVHRATRFTQTVAGQFTRSTDVTNSMLGIFLEECFFGSLHLNNHASEPLSESVVDVSCHAGSLFENGSLTLLFDELLSVRRHHDVVSQRLSKFDLVRMICAVLRMLDANKPAHFSRDKHWNSHEP